MMAAYEEKAWNREQVWEERFPRVPVVVPAALAQWLMRTFPFVGSMGVGMPVVTVGRVMFVLWFASTGQWWIQRVGVSA